jgi:hypothetical protein
MKRQDTSLKQTESLPVDYCTSKEQLYSTPRDYDKKIKNMKRRIFESFFLKICILRFSPSSVQTQIPQFESVHECMHHICVSLVSVSFLSF